MALSIGVKRGSQIRVFTEAWESLVKVKAVEALDSIVVDVDGRTYTITDLERQEVLPQVLLSCGRSGQSGSQGGYSRLAFEAPRSIRIERIPPKDRDLSRGHGVR